MSLPSSGTISASMIMTELGISVSNFSLVTARGGGYVPLNPYSPSLPKTTGDARYSDWYNYCHACTPMYAHTIYYLSPHANREGFDTKPDACAHAGVSATFYSSSSTLGVGSSLYFLSGGVYQPATFNQYGGYGGIWLWTSSIETFRMTSSSSNVIAEVQSCTPTYYYYDADYWVDCAGVTTYGVVVRSTVPLTSAWSRWGGTTGANYLNILGTTTNTSYTYDSDGTQNSYCGY